MTDDEAKSWHHVDRNCVDLDTGVARVEYVDREVFCYRKKTRWRFCYCKQCKRDDGALRSAKIVRVGQHNDIVSDPDNDSEREEWKEEQEKIANSHVYQAGLRTIWSTADSILGTQERYADYHACFRNFMREKMRMKGPMETKASTETEAQEGQKRRRVG